MFRTFHPFRILVCGGDGSVSWVLTEIDKLNMHNQVTQILLIYYNFILFIICLKVAFLLIEEYRKKFLKIMCLK